MQARTRTLQETLHVDRRFGIPVYQRPYGFHIDQWIAEKHYNEATLSQLLDEVRERLNRFVNHELPALVKSLSPLKQASWDPS